MDVLKITEELREVVESGFTIPVFGKTLVDKEELLELIEEIQVKMPEDLKQAKWVKEERQRILLEAQKQADAIVKDAENKFILSVDEHELTKKATENANEIASNAQKYAREIRLGAKEYADQILGEVVAQLAENLNTLRYNREQLKK
ncbi:MAG: ATPase [Hyphomonadaceae bacterium]|nr:ATPase [Clostridia bacterium]